jgi:hypothetical protein
MTYWNEWGTDPNMQTNLRSPGTMPTLDATFSSPYRLDITKVDYELARKLYYNRDERYKLGAGFSRPTINVPAGFMGIPILLSDKKGGDEQMWLDRFVQDSASQMSKAHVMALRDGEVLARLQPKNRSGAYTSLWTPDDKDLEIVLVPTEAFEIIYKEEDLSAIEAVKIKHVFMQPDSGGNMREVILFETITPTQIILKYENDEKPERKLTNPMGFVPAVHIPNEGEAGQLHASSDLEPTEPYMKFYNDVMLHAGSASQLHSTAKLVLRMRDVGRFLKNNFSDTEITEGRLRFKNKDVLFFESGDPDLVTTGSSIYSESAEIIQAKAPLGDTTTLLEFIFLNIVDVTEIPEWAFGGAIASSKASVSEQSGPIVHKTKRKRTMVEDPWALMGRMVLKAVLNQKERVTTTWSELGMRDLKTEGEAFRNFSESLLALNDGQMVSKHTSVEILRKLMKEIDPYDLDESPLESDRIEDEVKEKMAQMEELMADQQEQDENEDRESGLSVVERDSGPNSATG